jgi:phosphohistidine phosphatase
LCSTATRARRTWELVRAALAKAPETSYLDELYLAPPGRMLQLVRQHGKGAKRLLLVGHNPGMQALALRLARVGDASLRRALAEKFPTGALARLSFEAEKWKELESGRLLNFWRPRDLA